MKIFDTQNKRDRAWAGSGFTMNDDYMVLRQAAQAKHPISVGAGKHYIKTLLKRRSGNGSLFLSIVGSSGKIFFKKNITVTKNSWTEFSFPIEFSSSERGIYLHVGRDRQSFGTVEIGRIIISSEKEDPIVENHTVGQNRTLLHSPPIATLQQNIKSVAILIPYAIFGGAEVYLKTLISSVQSDSFVFNFLYLNKNANLNMGDGPNIHHKIMGNLPKLEADLVANNYDIIIYYNSLSLYNGLLDILERYGLSAKLVEIYHSDFRWADSLSQIKQRRVTDTIFSVSESLGNDITSEHAISKKTLPVPINISHFSPLNIKEKHERPIIGTVARLSPEKNIEYVIDIAEKIPEFDFIIVGDGPTRSEIESKIIQKNISNVKMIGHKIDTKPFYDLMDGFLLTSVMEGTPVTILEAGASGLPVFTTAVGGIPDIVSDGVTGFFITNDIDQDVRIIKNNINNKDVGKNAREFVVKNHNSVEIANKFINSLYQADSFYKFIDNRSNITLLTGGYV